MRIGSTILLHNGSAFQSYGWSMWRPLGGLQNAISSIEEYEYDEIAIILPLRTNKATQFHGQDIELVRNLDTTTPISFGGGIRSVKNLEQIRSLPIERLLISSAMIEENLELITKVKEMYGSQAIQTVLPVRKNGETILVFHSTINRFVELKCLNIERLCEHSNEVIIYDVDADGNTDEFDFEILKFFDIDNNKIVITGGVGAEVIKKAETLGIASCLIDNRTLHSEYSLAKYK